MFNKLSFSKRHTDKNHISFNGGQLFSTSLQQLSSTRQHAKKGNHFWTANGLMNAIISVGSLIVFAMQRIYFLLQTMKNLIGVNCTKYIIYQKILRVINMIDFRT